MMADPGKLDYESMNIDHQSPFRGTLFKLNGHTCTLLPQENMCRYFVDFTLFCV